MDSNDMNDDELKNQLERLAARGEPRGAMSVLQAARTRGATSAVPSMRRLAPAMAIAAAVSLIGGVAAAVVVTRDDSPQFAARPVATVPPGSTTTGPPAPPEVSIPAKLIAASRLVAFSNCNTYTTYMRTKGLQVVSAYGLPSIGGGYGRGDVMMASGAAERNSATAGAPAADSSKAAAPAPQAPGAALATTDDAFSTTNVQEAGIDEPDVVKTDGKRIYALSNGRLFVVDAAKPRILGSMEVGAASELFVVGNRVVLFSNGGGGMAQPAADARTSGIAAPYPYRQATRIIVVDAANPEALKEISHLDVDGSYVSARLVGGVARIVLSSYSSRMQFTYPTDGSPEAQAVALEKNKAVVRNAKFDDWVPHYTVTDSAGRPSAEKPLVACDSAYRPPSFSGFGQLSVMSLDPKNPTAAKTTSVSADGQLVYGSGSRLYVATTQWGDVKPMPAEKMMAPEIAPPVSPKTLIHAFDITDPGQATYKVSGSVRGTALNQFSFSEHDGNLRVATTDGDESYVSVLADDGKILNQVGQVGGLGKGERIYAVRFIGPVGYVVTFRQVDPLYVINLSDPTKPRVVGELKILGYSAYLHPVSDTLLIGVGQDATAEGRRAGTQVSLFDVSNPAAPKLLQKHALGQGNSQAEYDHHAFLYWAPKQLAVIPLQQYDATNSSPGFMGAVGMHVVPNEIREVGRVTNHNDAITRSLVIGDHLFTLSYNGLQQSDLGNFAEQAWVPFGNPTNSGGGSPGQVEPAPPSASGTDGGPTR
jgi:uncharacterized secreted protein with C-terminal beta-propeller domain